MPDESTIGHLINTTPPNPTKCPKCGKGPEHWEIRDYSMLWHDGEIYCECGQYIRMYDAG